jgi:tetratricopeptide (TPR) repeat protein
MFFSVIFLFVIWLISKVKEIKVRRYILWGIVGVGLVTMVISVFSFLSPGGYLRDLYLKQASNARPIVWELSKKSINERPLLGWGIDNFDRSFEKNYDNTILEQKNGAEAWFDRAHNIFIDQAVETGYVGLLTFILVYIVIFGSLIYVTLKSKNKTDQILSVVVITYFLGHIMELQTGFDTTISYVALIIMVTLASNLFYKTYSALHPKKSIWETSKVVQNVIGAGLLIGAITLFTIGTIPIVRAENANGAAHRAGSSEKRVAIYPVLFGSPLDKATMLWRTLHDFQRGISEKPHLLDDPKKTAGFAKELSFFTEEYRKYANNHPLDYRVRVSLAGAYMYERLLGIDHLNEAQVVLDDAISLYPNIPQAYWMKAVSYLYQQKFDLAREWAKKAHEINPNIEQSQKIIDYIEESIKTFPTINFFTFSQI